MTTEPRRTLENVPEHLPEDLRTQLETLAEESAVFPLMTAWEPWIRHWCETLEDGNPLYLDEEYAKSQGFRGIVAPPAMNMTLSIPYRWPASDTKPGPNLHYQLKKLMKTPVGVVVDIDTEYVRFVEAGDQLFMTQRLASMTGPKKTRMGEGYFWIMESILRNQRGEITSLGRTTMFAHNPGLPTDEDEDDTTPASGLSQATEDALEADRCTHLPPEQFTYWDDVHEGDSLPTLVMPITVTRCIYLASATRDFSPHHSNRDYAQQQVAARDMFLNTPFNAGMMSRFVTEWGGPASRLRKLKLRMKENVCAGDDMILDGQITKKYVDDGDARVDVEIQVSTQDGQAYTGAATLMLPQRDADQTGS